jgi:hypothetical protein
MGLRDPLPRSVSWITRTIGYSVGAVAIAVAWYVAGNVLLVKHYTDCMELPSQRGASKPTALESAKALVACVDGRSGLVETLAFWQTKRLFSALPSAPCDYVGTWRATREKSVYQITLRADGQFLAEPVQTSDRDARNLAGSWGVVGKLDSQKMVWLYDEGRVWPPDVNPIKNARADGFTLVEENGSRTEFSRTGGETCPAIESTTIR